jgi:hypothetical protein
VIGVHSPKFEHEKDARAVEGAMLRHGISHPVLNDPQMQTWSAYGARAWPTLVLISPRGEIVARYSGEGHGHALAIAVQQLVDDASADGTLVPGPGPFVAIEAAATPYLQPSKAALLSADVLAVSDTGHHQLALATPERPDDPRVRIGSGVRGHLDGAPQSAQFREPNGLVRLPADVAIRVGYDVVVADSGNHVLRGLRLSDLHVSTVAGTGRQWMQGGATSGSATAVDLSTPWDVAWVDDRVLIAMAGDHRLWAFDPVTASVEVVAGTTQEGLADGPAELAWFAQPSAVVADGDRAWIVDAETSALRTLTAGKVRTHIGRGLFDFGHVDGPADRALLQHPLGAAVLPDGAVLIADAYNGALRMLDRDGVRVVTVARGLAEPSDVTVLPDAGGVLVVESAAGRVSRVPLGSSEIHTGERLRTIRPAITVAPGEVTLEVVFHPPAGQKRDDRHGPSTQVLVDSSPPSLLESGSGAATDLVRVLTVSADHSEGVLHVAARGASCDVVGEHPACHMHQQDWGIPLMIDPAGSRVIRLDLAG